MNEILLILHFFGLAAAAGASIANTVVLRQVMAAPGDAPVLGKVQLPLSRAGQVGLGLLWLTGLTMVWSRFGGPENLPWTFWIKFLCVLGVTGGVVMLDILAKRARAGDQGARGQLPIYGAATGSLLVLVVIFAVVTFD